MWISDTSIKRPVFATMVIMSFMVLGAVSMALESGCVRALLCACAVCGSLGPQLTLQLQASHATSTEV